MLTLAVVRLPNTSNHVRYVIEALPALVLLVAHGAVVLGRRAGTRGALATGLAVGVALVAVDLGRGSALADYKYRNQMTAADRFAVSRDTAYLRRSSRRRTCSSATTRPSPTASSIPARTPHSARPAGWPAPKGH